MRNQAIGYIGTAGLLAMAFVFYFIPSVPEAAALTVTQTVTGYAIPNANGLNYGLVPFLLPIIMMGLFAAISKGVGIEGETNSFVIKFGLFIGCLLGMLSLTSSAPTLVPLGFPVVAGVFLITYIWKKV